ncbi:uncharacterized protein LOC116733131 isoform X2 [Xiphophorus hellerii]|uniref:uncharacterized protein LOC116733131 isoform X2 n=1 Tax=Xiphophorus hellerii TaxID=8084 RepID=UPI0013B40602|nr:uncharacterized protein LOC116733131 isoform X2 [Xiphophorus hellerii]
MFCGSPSTLWERTPTVWERTPTLWEAVWMNEKIKTVTQKCFTVKKMMKMISRILLLLILSSCLCAATFVVNVTQSSYQAEENHSITLEWTFPTKTQGSSRELFIICEFRSSVKPGVTIYVHRDGDEFPESQDEQFSGRVQIDKDVLREGRIRLHVSRLRTEDSGLYLCDVKTEDGSNSGRCRLNVTAADVSPVQRTTLDPEPEGRGRIGLHVSLGLTTAAAADVSPVQRTTLDPEPEGRGRIGLHVSLGLTTAAAADVSPVQRTTLDPEPEGRGRIGLHVSLLLTAAAAAALMVKLFLTLSSKG